MAQAETLEPQPAPSTTPPAKHRPDYSRLTNAERAFALKFAAEGFTQAEIAQRLGCTQSAICRWLAQCEDSTGAAKSFLRGSALSMARRVVKDGTPTTDIAALKGLSVLQDEGAQGLTIVVGAGSAVQVNLGTQSDLRQAKGQGPSEGPLIPE
jgi:ParB-like chromosome segregation protein Spo0J